MAPSESYLLEFTPYVAPAHTGSLGFAQWDIWPKCPLATTVMHTELDKHRPTGACTFGTLFGNELTCCEEAQAATWRGLATPTTSHISEAILDHWESHFRAPVTNHGAVGGSHSEDMTTG